MEKTYFYILVLCTFLLIVYNIFSGSDSNGHLEEEFEDSSDGARRESRKPPVLYDSCKTIKINNPSATSGVYYIKKMWNATKVYCDMETDGGGWTLIGRVTTTTKTDVDNYNIHKIISENLAQLDKAATENFLLSGELFPTLQSYINFREFRLYCTKPYHGRKHHVSFNDRTTPESKKIFDYVMGIQRYIFNLDNTCKVLKYLPDDNSVTRFTHCIKNKIEQREEKISERFYHSIWHIERRTSFSIMDKRLRCDDVAPYTNDKNRVYNDFGTWLYYVR